MRLFTEKRNVKRELASSALTAVFSMAALAAADCAHSQVTVTPGTVSGFNFFPPKPAVAVIGTSDGKPVEGLNKCYRGQHLPDASYVLNSKSFWSGNTIRMYYKILGGDGGLSANGGGGGSSILFQNGNVVAIGPGGDGNKEAKEVFGEFWVKPGDVLRLITGGGGGTGVPGAAGGGGGAGWKGGGAGGMYTPGKGGTDNPGAGGTGGGASQYGTAGVNSNGGVSMFPDGNSAPTGNGPNYTWHWASIGWGLPGYPGAQTRADTRWPATPSRNGSFGVPVAALPYNACVSGHVAGFGGAWGMGGAHAPFFYLPCPNVDGSATATIISNPDGTGTSYTGRHVWEGNDGPQDRDSLKVARSESFPNPESFVSTRVNNGYYITSGWLTGAGSNGSLPGQITLMYSSVDCSLL